MCFDQARAVYLLLLNTMEILVGKHSWHTRHATSAVFFHPVYKSPRDNFQHPDFLLIMAETPWFRRSSKPSEPVLGMPTSPVVADLASPRTFSRKATSVLEESMKGLHVP